MGLANPVAFVTLILTFSVGYAQTPAKPKPAPVKNANKAGTSAPAKSTQPAKPPTLVNTKTSSTPTNSKANPQTKPPTPTNTQITPAPSTTPSKPSKTAAPQKASTPTASNPSEITTIEVPRTSIKQDSWAVGIMAWPEKIKITDEFGVSHDANVQIYAPSFHLSRRETRARYGIIYEVYAFFGKADVQTEPGENLSYFQKRVGVYGFGGDVGVFLRPEAKQINIGISAPLQYRKANFTNPPVGGSVTNKDIFSLGWMLDFRWRITPDVAINQRVGSFLGQPGSLWMINAEWTL